MKENLTEKKISEILTRDVYVVNLEQTWASAARKMHSHGFHHLVVVDENHNPVTIISAFDFLEFAYREGEHPGKLKLGDSLGDRKLHTIEESKKLYDALNMMNFRHIDALAVVNEENRLTGIVTSRDLMNVLSD